MARVAFVLAEMFEDSEFTVPFERLRAAGHELVIVGREAGQELRGKSGKETARVDLAASSAEAGQFDALVIPGGYSPDRLRTEAKVVRFVREVAQAEKPVAAICHAGSLLIEADVVEDRRVTSWPSICTDLINAGARWVDREVVEDGWLITSRKPDDLPAFCDALLRKLAEVSTARASGQVQASAAVATEMPH